ncbi:hypothetical protein [Phenylobacterium sp.]|jgi:hypothetical protein|uniref:hypothetical protein n=1 Tax=Phenylobacterium sp. TaxID=1871053 RepID=UPI002E3708FC|nr:hypothetical protein [Phenylobacterium sp.]HEX3363796.1 hypothetical protein [Phenylobacterium sp.]
MTDKSKIQGEGNYDAARKFDKEERAFVKKGGIEQKAKDAEAALEGPEGADLEKARKEADERGHMDER